MPGEYRGRFIREGMEAQLSASLLILKYITISIIFYPWYYFITKSWTIDRLMGYALPTFDIDIEHMTYE